MRSQGEGAYSRTPTIHLEVDSRRGTTHTAEVSKVREDSKPRRELFRTLLSLRCADPDCVGRGPWTGAQELVIAAWSDSSG